MKTKYAIQLIATLFMISSSYGQKYNVEKNLKMYEDTWDNIINKRQINEINSKNFDANITLVTSPENIIGIEDFKAYYQNFLTGFSEITFTIIDVFGQNDKIVKHWNFKGKNTGEFFGIPATGNTVDIDGASLVKMINGKIAQEQDFMDNMVFLSQLGLVSDPNNMTIIDNLYKAFSTGDIPSVLDTMNADIVWNEAEGNAYADGNPYIGPDAVLQGVFARIGAEHEYFNLTDIQLHEISNNQVLATLRYNAKVKKNGAEYNAQAAHLWTLKDGKIITFQQYVDTKKLAEAFQK
jgi:hypothetical protein